MAAAACVAAPVSEWSRVATPERVQTLVAPRTDAAHASYPVFPALLPLDRSNVLVTYKEGRGHTHDPGALVASFNLELADDEISRFARFNPFAPLLFQCTEPARFVDGTLALFIDTQRIGPEPRHYRAPMRWTVSRDGGATFSPPVEFPRVDGIGYGYPFEARTLDGVTYFLVMTFGYLDGGRWSADIIRTDDNRASWRAVRNLSEEFSVPGFNEGSFLPTRDGFIVASRSYDQQARLHEVDCSFRLRRQVNLTSTSPWINGYVGRPRLFRHGDGIYLIGRNWTQPAPIASAAGPDNPLGFPRAQQLYLFRIDPRTLLQVSCWVLDNAELGPVTDGYYAVVATTGQGTGARLHVITYKAESGGPPSLLHFAFKWSDLSE